MWDHVCMGSLPIRATWSGAVEELEVSTPGVRGMPMQPCVHRIVEAGRYLRRSSGPRPLLKQGHLQPVASEHVQMAFE